MQKTQDKMQRGISLSPMRQPIARMPLCAQLLQQRLQGFGVRPLTYVLPPIAAIDTSTENFDRSMRTSPRFKNKLIRSILTSMHYMAVKTTAFRPSTRTYTLDMNLAPFPCLGHLYQIRGRPLVCAGSILAFRVPPARPSTSMLLSPAFRQWVSPDRKTAWMKGSRREMLHRLNRHAQRQAQQWRYIHLRTLCGY